MRVLILTTIVFCLYSIKTTETVLDEKLIGLWIFIDEERLDKYFERKLMFDIDKPGIEFKEDGTLLKRQNIGWCSTPPITYDNYDGIWKISKDSILTINYKYWGGELQESWKVKKIDEEMLLVKYLNHKRVKKE